MKTALIIVDVQNDFLPGGALGIKDASKILAPINSLMSAVDLVIASQDFHPKGHVSFITRGGLWPEHCIEGSFGAELSAHLKLDKIDKTILKGTNPDIDSYSAFFDNEKKHQTELDSFLKTKGVSSLIIVGLATDYCVKFTALDAIALGYRVFLSKEGSAAVKDEEGAILEMIEAGIQVLT